jgi:hypothetical protein
MQEERLEQAVDLPKNYGGNLRKYQELVKENIEMLVHFKRLRVTFLKKVKKIETKKKQEQAVIRLERK